MGRCLGGSSNRAKLRVALTAILFVFAILVPLTAFGSQRYETVSSSHVFSLRHADATSQGNQLPMDTAPADQDQPEESGKTAGGTTVLVEEEIKAKHDLADLSPMYSRAIASREKVDHAYEAWFYSVTHPPLTPPPNAR